MTGRTITGLRLLLPFLAGLSLAGAEPPVADAIKLYLQNNFPAARDALEKIVAADPANAAACYYLGMALRHRGDSRALDDAVVWLGKGGRPRARERDLSRRLWREPASELADNTTRSILRSGAGMPWKKAIRLNPGRPRCPGRPYEILRAGAVAAREQQPGEDSGRGNRQAQPRPADSGRGSGSAGFMSGRATSGKPASPTPPRSRSIPKTPKR